MQDIRNSSPFPHESRSGGDVVDDEATVAVLPTFATSVFYVQLQDQKLILI